MISFDIVDLEQGSDAWRLWRSGGIGASDAPTIMGENRWKSIRDLAAERSDPMYSVRPNAAMARGTALEPQARAGYCRRMGFEVYPLCIQSKEHPWLRCSLDGICMDRMHIVEIKCGDSTYRHVRRRGSPPRHYYGQLQHTMLIADLGEIDFWCYVPGGYPILITVGRDGRYIENLLKTSLKFWETTKRYAAR